MSLESIYYIGQTIAVIAILGSLIAVMLQMRQANRLAREAAQHAQVEDLQSISKAIFETPRLASIWGRGLHDLDSLDAEERIRFIALQTYTLRVYEGVHLRHLRGEIEEDVWKAHVRQMGSAQSSPGFQAVWEIRRDMYSPAFQAFFAQNAVASASGEDPYGRKIGAASASEENRDAS